MPTIVQGYNWLPGSIPWAEFISARGGTSSAALGFESGNTASFNILVNWRDLDTAVQLLGTTTWDSSSQDKNSWRLSRTPPVRNPHPWLSHLYAYRITDIHGIQWLSKDTESPLSGQGAISTYAYALLSIAFSQPRWNRTLGDAELDRQFPPVTTSDGIEVRQEWARMTSYEYAPDLEQLTQDGTFWVFAETSSTGPGIGTKFGTTMGWTVPKADLHATWHRIPGYNLFPGGSGVPTWQYQGLGCVNDQAFLTYPAGTLRLAGLNFRPLEGPYPPWGPALLENRSPIFYDVGFFFQIKDPPIYSGNSTRGHNLAPWRDGRWYAVNMAGDSSRSIYAKYQFEKLFWLNSNT